MKSLIFRLSAKKREFNILPLKVFAFEQECRSSLTFPFLFSYQTLCLFTSEEDGIPLLTLHAFPTRLHHKYFARVRASKSFLNIQDPKTLAELSEEGKQNVI